MRENKKHGSLSLTKHWIWKKAVSQRSTVFLLGAAGSKTIPSNKTEAMIGSHITLPKPFQGQNKVKFASLLPCPWQAEETAALRTSEVPWVWGTLGGECEVSWVWGTLGGEHSHRSSQYHMNLLGLFLGCPDHKSNCYIVRTSTADRSSTDPGLSHQPSQAIEDIGFGPKINHTLTHLNSENICLVKLLWNIAKILHAILLVNHTHQALT